MRCIVAAAVFAVLATVNGSAAGQPPQQRTPRAPVRDAPRVAPPEAQLSRAWAAYAEGRYPEAARLAEDLVRSSAALRHDALALAIRADAARDEVAAAFDVYEQWTRGRADLALLEPVGEQILRRLATAPDPGLRAVALQRLRRAGRDVPKVASATDARDRAAGGDEAARDELLKDVAAGTAPGRRETVEALAEGGATLQQLTTLLWNRSPEVRVAAIEAIGRGKPEDVVASLTPLRDDPDPYVQLAVTVALARAGDATAIGAARDALNSPVAAIRLMAADAFQPFTPEAIGAIQSAFSDTDSMNRLRAARLLAPQEPSLPTVLQLLADENPAIRLEAAKVAEEKFFAELPLIRRMALDPDPWIRVYGAGGLLRRQSR